MPNHRDHSHRSNSNSNWNSRRDEETPHRRESSSRREWYDRDPMDERSGYRDSEDRSYSSQRDFSGPSRRTSAPGQGYEDFRHPSDYRNESDYRTGSDYRSDSDHRSGSSDYRTSSDYRGERSDRSERFGRDNNNGRSMNRGQTERTTQGMWSPSDSRGSEFRGSSEYRGNGYEGSSEYREGLDRDSANSRDTAYGYGQDWGSRMSSSSTSSSRMGQHSGRGPKGFKRSDERIKEEVCEMLSRDGSIDADDIDVEVKEGEVTLTGSVPEKRMKRLAEDCIENCFGVKDVTNNIRVKSSSDLSTSSSQSSTGSTTGLTGKKSSSSSTSTTNPSH